MVNASWLGDLGFNIPPTAKVIVETGPRFIVSSDRLQKPGVEPAITGLQDK